MFTNYLETKAAVVEAELARRIDSLADAPSVLTHAMRYSLEAGGKRLRPALVLAAAQACGLEQDAVLPAACAIEMVHTYSLIHDDLPAMDNAARRRGKPSSHKVYGEACAILAGDALLTCAFEVCAQNAALKKVGPARTCAALAVLARAAGACGMVGGQVSDIFAEGILRGESVRAEKLAAEGSAIGKKKPAWFLLPAGNTEPSRENVLEYIHRHKTGALLCAAVEMGSLLAGAKGRQLDALRAYGQETGMAFQIVDDILDVAADRKKLGKSGGDAASGKLTFVTLYGLDNSRELARTCIDRARRSLASTGLNAKRLAPLNGLAQFIMDRTY